MIDRSKPIPANDLPKLPIPAPEELCLKNGIKLVVINSPSVQDITRITFSWMGGSYDTVSSPLSTIATHLSVTGAKNISTGTFADALDFNGAILGSEVQTHSNTITLLSLNRTLDNLLPLIVEAINMPPRDNDEFTTIRDRIAASIATSLRQVTTQAEILDSANTFGPRHPASRVVHPHEIQEYSLSQALETLALLRGGQPPVVFIAGAVTPQVIETVTRHLGQIDCTPGKQSIVSIIPATPLTTSCAHHHEMKQSLQSAIRISTPTVNRHHPDYQTIRLMSMALGGYFGSRLMTSIREEQGLTYGINSGVYGYREGAFITITAQCDNRYTQRVIDASLLEIEKLASRPMDNREFLKLRQVATAGLLTMLDTPFSIADYYITRRHLDTPANYFELQQQAIACMTPQIIMETAAKYLVNKPMLVSTAGHKV